MYICQFVADWGGPSNWTFSYWDWQTERCLSRFNNILDVVEGLVNTVHLVKKKNEFVHYLVISNHFPGILWCLQRRVLRAEIPARRTERTRNLNLQDPLSTFVLKKETRKRRYVRHYTRGRSGHRLNHNFQLSVSLLIVHRRRKFLKSQYRSSFSIHRGKGACRLSRGVRDHRANLLT